MNEFERITESGFRKYDRMIIKSFVWVPDVGFCQMVLERMPRKEEYVGDITMTDFKKHNDDKLRSYINSEMKYYKKIINAKKEIIFLFVNHICCVPKIVPIGQDMGMNIMDMDWYIKVHYMVRQQIMRLQVLC